MTRVHDRVCTVFMARVHGRVRKHGRVPYLILFLRYGEILMENRRFNLPHLHLAPTMGLTPLEFHQDLWFQKTRVATYGANIAS